MSIKPGELQLRFDTQSEVQRFLQSRPEFPKPPSGEVTFEEVSRLLTQPLYAGYVEAPGWGISRRDGRHDGLIDRGTWQKIQDRLTSGARAPVRKNTGEVFALRGFVLCADCGNPLYSCQSRGKLGKRYPYYLCHTKTCPSYGKSIRRDDLEGEFEDLLKSLRPSKSVVALVRNLFMHAWDQRRAQGAEWRKTLRREIAKLETRIDGFLDKIADATSATAVTAYERRIEKLEAERQRVQGQLETVCKPRGPAENLEPALAFFSNPWKVWASGHLELRRMVLRLAFAERLAYCRKTGPRTPKTTLPFNMLGGVSGGGLGFGGAEGSRTLDL
ncbi:MAG: recombinase zinc beta ribbon domain-containing protein [Rhodospirillaceae bacterium]|nr:recombinase zinc beta ribbon domain-containing protein [Rhodospirillaceae bacterium]